MNAGSSNAFGLLVDGTTMMLTESTINTASAAAGATGVFVSGHSAVTVSNNLVTATGASPNYVRAIEAISSTATISRNTLSASGSWRGRLLGDVHGHLDAYLSACQLGITLASLGLGWIGEPAFARLLEPLFARFGVGVETTQVVALVLALLTVGVHSFSVARIKPVTALRYE